MNELPADDSKATPPATSYRRFLIVACLVLLGAGWLCLLYVLRERRVAGGLQSKNAELSASLSQTRSQLDALTAKLNAMSAPPPQPAQPPAKPLLKATLHRKAAAATPKHRPEENPLLKQIQAELAEHQKQITATQQDLEKTRTQIGADLKSTRDELGSSIARNHDELVALEKKGERSFYEFDVLRSKEFRHVGPVSISLRKADTKRQYCDLRILVDDVELTRKHVNLYEPVLFYPEGYSQALELVINAIEKNQARGYVSEPKYKAPQMTAGAAAAPAEPQVTVTNAAANLEHR
jgi:uncharacterized coiled-coil protein SlyX